jgi:hypothetical protein
VSAPALLDARGELRVAKFESDVRKLVDAARPLSDGQRNKLALVLLGGGDHAPAA